MKQHDVNTFCIYLRNGRRDTARARCDRVLNKLSVCLRILMGAVLEFSKEGKMAIEGERGWEGGRWELREPGRLSRGLSSSHSELFELQLWN